MEQTILWYDLETWGGEIAHGQSTVRIAQCAMLRTDLALNPIGKPHIYYAHPGREFVINPYAVMVHGLLPDTLTEDALTEWQLVAKLADEMAVPHTVVAGFNNLRFDNVVMRFAFYRHLMEPYLLDRGDSARFDILDMARLCHALRPEGLNWPSKEDGTPSFKLEDLARANNIAQNQAHDALSDVEATIGLARAIRTAQPKLFDYLWSLRDSRAVERLLQTDRLIDGAPATPILHATGMVAASHDCLEIMLPVAAHPLYNNQTICVGLHASLAPLLNMSSDDIRANIFAKKDALGDTPRLRIFTVHHKRCPALAPLNTLTEHQKAHHGFDEAMNHYQAIQPNIANLGSILRAVFAERPTRKGGLADPEVALYDAGFFSRQDRQKCQALNPARANSIKEVMDTKPFDHPHMKALLHRLHLRYAAPESTEWRTLCQDNWQQGTMTGYTLADFWRDWNAINDADNNTGNNAPAEPVTPTQRETLAALATWARHTYQ